VSCRPPLKRLLHPASRISDSNQIGLYQVDVAWSPFGAVELATPKNPVGRRAAGLGRDQAADEGADWLRVDVWTTNERLQHYYLRQGFTYVRTVVLPHNPSGALFQRPAQRVLTPHLQEVESLTG
jgi:hypothetical protein